MARCAATSSLPEVQFRVVAPVFFLFSFLFMGWQVDPALQLYSSGPVFFLDIEFFRGFLRYSGGLAEYAAAWVAQGSYFSWLGALLFAVESLMITGLTRRFLVGLGGTSSSLVQLVPGFLLLFLQSRYDGLPWQTGIELLVSLSVASVYFWLPLQSQGLRWAAFVAGVVLLYYVAGMGAGLLFTVLGAAYEGLILRRPGMGVGCLSVSALVLALGALLHQNLASDFQQWGKGITFFLAAGLFAFFPLLAISRIWWHPRTENKTITPAIEGEVSPTMPWLPSGAGRRFRLWCPPLLCVLGMVLVWVTFDGWHKALIQLDYQAQQKNWDQVLRLAYRTQTHRPATRLQINRALYHSGRMSSDLFGFGQLPGLDLFPGLDEGLEACRAMGDTLLELGHVNFAEHFAHEALEIEGDRPATLLQLARINVLMGRPQAARVFLHRLGKMPFHGREAADWLRDLETDSQLSRREEIARIRSVMVNADYPSSRPLAENLLRQLLQANPRNRMAFEYLMAHYLLNGDLDKVEQNIGRLKDLGYSNLPRNYEEAILLQQHLEGGRRIDLKGWTVNPRTIERFEQFKARLSGYSESPEKAVRGMIKEFGATYWYFYTFRQSFGTAIPRVNP